MSHSCRSCSTLLQHTFCDLGKTPPSNSYLKSLTQRETSFPLHAYVCHHCFLVQLGQFQTPDEIFSDYAYFSSFSNTWVEHGRKYTEEIVSRFSLNAKSFVIEIASNDGYLLQHFKANNIPILGIEPAKNVAQVAIGKGIPTLTKFFGRQTASELVSERKLADLIVGNNVLAHVPDLNDFVSGLKILLSKEGIITLEFPHLLQLISQNQFDTIYHEHFSYFSLISVEKVFVKHGLELFDVEQILTHGGSLRVYLQHAGGKQVIGTRVSDLKEEETSFGLHQMNTYQSFFKRTQELKKNVVEFLTELKKTGKKVVGYGAPAKGNTLLNYCGITTDLLPFTVDLSPHKQGHFLPGSKIPIYAPEKIYEHKPDYLLILPWNLKTEIQKQMSAIRGWGGKFILPIPQVTVE
jgi:2-polyprenyl-3-methyl-5-hydroxy-6-metoxy-1,4-benzoquinol methylase